MHTLTHISCASSPPDTHTHTFLCLLKLPKTLLIQTFTYKFYRPLIYWGLLGWDYRYTAVVTLPSRLKLAFIPVKNRFGRSLLILKHQLQRLRPLGDGVLWIISIVWWHLKPTMFLWNQCWKRLSIETVCYICSEKVKPPQSSFPKISKHSTLLQVGDSWLESGNQLNIYLTACRWGGGQVSWVTNSFRSLKDKQLNKITECLETSVNVSYSDFGPTQVSHDRLPLRWSGCPPARSLLHTVAASSRC